MAQIVSTEDLYGYSIAMRNSGITAGNLQMLERQTLIFLFGKEGARRLVREINAHTTESPRVRELLQGDDELFAGLRALVATIICTNLLSQNRVLVGRQNVARQPMLARPTQRREEAEVVQALAFSARNLIFAMQDYLRQEDRNPLGLEVEHAVQATRYGTDTSGRIPAAVYGFPGLLNW